MAASESSILSELGITAEEFEKEYGEPLDLSERHLAWYMANALPDVKDFPNGEYPYEESQAGEGFHLINDTDENPMDFGGNPLFATTYLAAGIGVVEESLAPYQSNEGTVSSDDDWSLPELDRFMQSYELKDSNVLPSPAGRDKDGQYIYRPAGTEAIKNELLKGHAVSISCLSDQSGPLPPVEVRREELKKRIADKVNVSEEDKAAYIEARIGAADLAQLTEDELTHLITVRYRVNGMPEDYYDLTGLDHDELATLLVSDYFGYPYEELVEVDDYMKNRYLNFTGSDPVVYAQYTYEQKLGDHTVCIVGWDDSFPASSFKEDHQPPADGAWIVKKRFHTFIPMMWKYLII